MFPKRKDNDLNKKLTITSLLSAVKQGRKEQIENSLQKYGIPKSGIKNTDYSILQLAIEMGKIEIAKLLIYAGCRLNLNDNNVQRTPLALSIRIENEELTDLLLQKQGIVNATSNSNTPVLHIAAQGHSLKMLRFLFQYPFDVNSLHNGKTPLQVYLEYFYQGLGKKEVDTVKLFLEKGATINFKLNTNGPVLHRIIISKDIDLIAMLLTKINDINELNNNKDTALHILFRERYPEENIIDILKLLLSKGAKIDIQNQLGDTVIHISARNKYLKIMKIFLLYQWDINCCNKAGNTVLHLILQNSNNGLSNNEEYYQIVKHILKQKSLKLDTNNDGETPLILAAINKQHQILDNLLDMPVDINATDKNGFSALYAYMRCLLEIDTVLNQNNIDIVKKMISKGANSDFYSLEHCTPMHIAIQLKNKEIILHMLEFSFNFSKFQEAQGKPILHYLYSSDVDFTDSEDIDTAAITEICIKKGVKVNQMDKESKTPLYWAVLMRRKYTVKTLLEYGADPNLCNNQGGTILENLMKKATNATALSLSIYTGLEGHSNVFKSIPISIEKDADIAEMLLFKKANAEKISNNNQSIFHYCAENSHLDMLHKIIPYCKNVNIRDSSANTILHKLLANNRNETQEIDRKVAAIVTILISKGAEVEVLNERNLTPLQLAASGKHLETSNILLRNKARIDLLDVNGNSVLHLLCILRSQTDESVDKALSELFIGKGCDVNATNQNGMTPLSLAAVSGSVNMFRILLKHGANVNCTENKNLNMPIHLAAKHNCPEIIEELIKNGVDVNDRNKDRNTALHLSVRHKTSKVTKLLLKNGADTQLKDFNGKTPLHWACWYESLDNINELLEYGADINAEDKFYVTPLMLIQFSTNTWTKLYYHVVKLRAANVPISKRNAVYIKTNAQRAHYTTAALIGKFQSTAVEETLKMEAVSIAPRISLVDVLQMSANRLSVIKCNELFQQVLFAEDFKQKFPIYADMISACYRKGVVRSDLLVSARDAFQQVLRLPLPSTCCEAIFHYLDNENLQNIVKSAEIKISNKRKRFFDEINDSVPTKRVRRLSV